MQMKIVCFCLIILPLIIFLYTFIAEGLIPIVLVYPWIITLLFVYVLARMSVKMKYGIISIGFFFAHLAGLAILLRTSIFVASSLEIIVVLATLLCLFLGIVFGTVGTLKKESPKWYSSVGFLLNFCWVCLLVYAFLNVRR